MITGFRCAKIFEQCVFLRYCRGLGRAGRMRPAWSGVLAACGPQGNFARPAMFLGSFKWL